MSRLEELLLQTGLLSREQLAKAKRHADETGTRLAQSVIDSGLVDEQRFGQWFGQVSGAPYVDPLPAGAVAALQRRIPRAIAREYEVLPMAIDADILTVASVDPLDDACADILRTTTGMNIRMVAARSGAVRELIARFYPEDDADSTILPPGVSEDDDELGNSTRFVPPPAAEDTNPVRGEKSQLDRIEARLDELAVMVQGMQQRIEFLETLLQRLTSR